MALPLRARNGLAALVLGALHDRGAREALEAVAALDTHPQARGDTALPASLPADIVERHGSRLSLAPGLEAHRSEIIERARRGAEALRGRPFSADTPSLGAAWRPRAGSSTPGCISRCTSISSPTGAMPPVRRARASRD